MKIRKVKIALKKPTSVVPARQCLVQSQLTDTKYAQVWYDLTIGGELQMYNTPADAEAAARLMKTMSKKTRWRVIDVVKLID